MEWWGWAILGIACMVIEVHLTQDFTLFCVGVAAFVVTAVAAFAVDLPFWSHWLLFSALAVVVLLTVRKPLLGRLRARSQRRPKTSPAMASERPNYAVRSGRCATPNRRISTRASDAV
jgi:membrane protein implicated in regulation of membrane protease activity